MMLRERIGSLSLGQLVLVAAALLLPAIVALIALAGESWRMVDRPLYSGRLWDTDFAPSLVRGLFVSVGFGGLLATIVAVGLSRRRAHGSVIASCATIAAAAALVLVPTIHSFWLADAVDITRLAHPTDRQNVIFDLLSMSGSQWAQAAPYVLLSVYGIAALAAVLGAVSVHAKERIRRQREPRRSYNVWSAF